MTVSLLSTISAGDTLVVDDLPCREVSESVDVALSLPEHESVDVFARYLRSPGGLLPDGSVAAQSARRSRRLRERSRTLASSRQVLARSTRWCSRRSPGGVLEVVQGCTGRRGAQLPVLSDVVAPGVVAPAAGADSSEGGRGPARGDVVTARAAAAELIARGQCGLSAFTSSPAALWQDGSLWTSSLGVLVADDLVAPIGRLRAAHAALLASVDGVDGVEREWAFLDACKRSPTGDSPEQRRFGRAVLDLQAVQLRLCRFLVELEPHAVGSSGEPVRSRSSASASVSDRSSGPRDAGLDDGVVHTGGNTGVVAGAETRASSAADGVPDADHAVPITARFAIAESEAAAPGAGAEAGASSASDRSSGPVGAAVEHGAPQVLGDHPLEVIEFAGPGVALAGDTWVIAPPGCSGGRGHVVPGDLVIAQHAVGELSARGECGLNAYTAPSGDISPDGLLWASSVAISVAADVVASVDRLCRVHATLVECVDGAEQERAVLDACQSSPAGDSPVLRRCGRAALGSGPPASGEAYWRGLCSLPIRHDAQRTRVRSSGPRPGGQGGQVGMPTVHLVPMAVRAQVPGGARLVI